MSTDGWNDQKDIFLNGLDALIKGLKKPDLVQRAEFERAQGQYKRALDTINADGLFLHPAMNMLTEQRGQRWLRLNALVQLAIRRGAEANSALVREVGTP